MISLIAYGLLFYIITRGGIHSIFCHRWHVSCIITGDWQLSDKFLCISFPDQEIRKVAVEQLDNLLSDELLEYLPQLVQVRTSELPRDSRIFTTDWFSKKFLINQQYIA
jgi:hypothetical protein